MSNWPIASHSDAAVCDRESAVKRLWDEDELTIEWMLERTDHTLLANKTGATRLGFAALLTFFRHDGEYASR